MERPGVPDDTHPEMYRRQIEGLRAMTPAQRFEMTMALCANASELAFAGMRLRHDEANHGELSEAELRRRLAIMRYGPELVAKVDAYKASHRERDACA